MKVFGSALLFLFCSASYAADVLEAKRQQMLADLDFIRGVYDSAYAPAAWKERHVGWDLGREIDAAKAQINASENLTNRDFQRILKGFFQSTKDYHVGVSFHGTERSSLPIVIRGAEGRFFLVHIDRKKLSKESFPFTEGDEVLRMDGEPVSEIVERFRQADDSGVPSTDQALAELSLTNRRANRFAAPVARGPVMFELKRKSDGKVVRHQLVWDYVPEAVPEWNGAALLGSKAKAAAFSGPAAAGLGLRDREMITPVAKSWMADGIEANAYSLGYRTSYLPSLGERIWESGKEAIFDAYIYRNSRGKLIGYIRMPNYVCQVADGERNETKPTSECFAEFAATMAKFEKVTDGLVIDQLNNPGGSVFYLYALASTLTDQPLFTPRHRMAVSQEDVATAASTLPQLEKVGSDEEARKLLGSDLGGYPVSHQTVQYMIQYFRFMTEEFKAGRKLTEPYYIWGVDQINPHATARYTKPVLVLVNSLDFSGGDFFPAILQDNKRITVMGTRTAGAGGYVLSVAYPNLFGVAGFSFTGSLAERIDRNPIENLGVTPDVVYELKASDLQNNYVDYVKAIQAQLLLLVK